jgi:starch phosphorylase
MTPSPGAADPLGRRLAGPVAYFSMEVALESHAPTYSGGLGVLAGDTLRTAADLGLPMVGVTLVYHRGHFFQRLDAEGRQHEESVRWSPGDRLEATAATCRVQIEDRPVTVGAWRYAIVGVTGHVVPVFLLDTDVPDNDAAARRLTDQLYGGDERYRLSQEIVLGVGGVRMLRALGYDRIVRFHMNEGHSALLALELYAEARAREPAADADTMERVRRQCVFTTHTPVPAGHDRFPLDLVRKVLAEPDLRALEALGCCRDEMNMTLIALRLSHYVNGVTRRHGEVSSSMFPGYHISSVTNGVHSATWTSPPFQRLYDYRIPDWRKSSFILRYAGSIPLDEIRAAHREAKRMLVDEVNERTNAGFDRDVFTIGFARRAAAYKRPGLVLHDPGRLRQIARSQGPLQLVFAGKAHPRDESAKALIEEICRRREALAPDVSIAWLPNYDLRLGLLITAGVDLWLNTPKAPQEASGTSGMKAAHNGVPSLSVLDGWWWEGHIEGVTGWAVGPRDREALRDRTDDDDAADIYRLLETEILPRHRDPERWAELMRHTIALNASFFNAERMLLEYTHRAYLDDAP